MEPPELDGPGEDGDDEGRPIGVTLLVAGLVLVVAVLLPLTVATSLAAFPSGPVGVAALIAAWAATTAVLALLAYGLWHTTHWAWPLGMAVFGVAAAVNVASVRLEGSVLAVLVVLYLVAIRHRFGGTHLVT